MNIAQALQLAREQNSAALDAQIWLLHVANQQRHDRAWLVTHEAHVLSSEQATRFQQGLQRLQQGEPLAYLVGMQAFHRLELHVTPDVLIPRADTETLVDWALALPLPHADVSVLDLGTGSGAIALALQHQRPNWEVHAVDASPEALRVAQQNAERLGLPIHLHLSDWFSQVQGLFDLIVSNPPYIAEDDPHLPALHHEPTQALVSGADGLRDLHTLAHQAPAHLKEAGWLLLEHGHTQAPAVCERLRHLGFQGVQSRLDLAGIARCSGGQRPKMK